MPICAATQNFDRFAVGNDPSISLSVSGIRFHIFILIKLDRSFLLFLRLSRPYRRALTTAPTPEKTMKYIGTFVSAAAIVATLAGCQAQMLSDSRIADNTAGILGVSPASLTISDRRSEATNTYYLAQMQNGQKYACVINGGGALAMGMVNPPSCNPIH
jgi:hypothetical protein